MNASPEPQKPFLSFLRSCAKVGAIVLAAVVCLWIGALLVARHQFQRNQNAWKNTTIQHLAALSLSDPETSIEFSRLKTAPVEDAPQHWASDHVILMANGEYLLCDYYHAMGFIGDNLLLAHASNGRWLYSTYHFCTGMLALGADKQPTSISDFSHRYYAREFNGKPDFPFEHTWP